MKKRKRKNNRKRKGKERMRRKKLINDCTLAFYVDIFFTV